jgi:hypothetical protein
MEEEKNYTNRLSHSEKEKSVSSEKDELKESSEQFEEDNYHQTDPEIMKKHSEKNIPKMFAIKNENELKMKRIEETKKSIENAYTSSEAKLKSRAENNNSSPTKAKRTHSTDPLVNQSSEEVKLNTHNYFHPPSVQKDLQSSSPKFQKEHYESFNTYSGIPIGQKSTHTRDEITEYTREEMFGFKTVFNTFDKNKTGTVKVADLRAIFESLKRDPEEVEAILGQLGMQHEVSFDEFVKVMQLLENEMDKTQNENDEVYSKQLEQEQFGELENENDLPEEVMRRDIGSVPQSHHYFTAGEDEQEEPKPAVYEVVDDDSGEQSQNQEDIQEETEQLESKNYPEPRIENVIPEHDKIEEDQENENLEESQIEDISRASSTYSFKCPTPPSTKERRLYGTMLPKHGVYFLPDLKVVDFIRVLNNYKRQCLKEGKLAEAKRSKNKINELRNKEMLRQLTNM